MSVKRYYTLRTKVTFDPRQWVIGFLLAPEDRMFIIQPTPCVEFMFWISREPKRHITDIFIEFALVVMAANLLAFSVALILSLIVHREEVIVILKQLFDLIV